jgi:hypothetical protein
MSYYGNERRDDNLSADLIKRNKLPARHKHYVKDIILISAYIIVLLALCLIKAKQNSHTSDFNPINGDFQNYNPIRRLLAGQVPYKDFPVYLGAGHLYVGALLVWIFGNNFTASLFSMEFITVLCFELWIFSIAYIIIRDKVDALFLALGFAILNFIRPDFILNNLMPEFLPSFNIGLTVGNSARLFRGTAPIILAILAIFGIKLLLRLCEKYNYIKAHISTVINVYLAFITGMMMLWSNDYGIASGICYFLVYNCVLIKKYKNNIKKILFFLLLYITVGFCSIILAVAVITHGNISNWFEFTYGVSSSQSWYYGIFIEKSFFLYDMDFGYITIFILALALFYIYKLFKTEYSMKSIIRYGAPAYLLLSGFFAANIYKLMSGSVYREVAYLILLIVIISELYLLLRNVMKFYFSKYIRSSAVIILLLFSTLFCFYSGLSEVFKQHSGEYFDSLNGYITELAPSLNLAKQKIGNDMVFSTYSSAVEVITNQFQPSGSDYIIHVFGEKQRNKYLNSFNNADFKYAATIRESYTSWEYWIRNANWFFYRELYNHYTPEFATEYEIFWRRTEKENVLHPSLTTKVDKVNDHSYRITVKTDDPTINGTADVSVSYATKRNESFFKNFAFNRMIYVTEISQGQIAADSSYCNFFMPPSHDNYYIPVTIINGMGEAVLSCCPNTGFDFALEKANVEGIYLNPFNYLFLSSLSDVNWNNGISRSEPILLLDNTKENQIALSCARKLKSIEGVYVTVSGIETTENYIRVTCSENQDLSTFSYPNKIEVIQ